MIWRAHLIFGKFHQSGNSSGTFVSASEDETGVMDLIEQKIARATMIPRTHGEVCFIVKLPIFNNVFFIPSGHESVEGVI